MTNEKSGLLWDYVFFGLWLKLPMYDIVVYALDCAAVNYCGRTIVGTDPTYLFITKSTRTDKVPQKEVYKLPSSQREGFCVFQAIPRKESCS
jgi:hypothetical protein